MITVPVPPLTSGPQGQFEYRGLQLHSRDFTSAEVARGKDILVVGSGKTGLDCVAELTLCGVAKSVKLLYRQVGHAGMGGTLKSVCLNRQGFMEFYPEVCVPSRHRGIGREAFSCRAGGVLLRPDHPAAALTLSPDHPAAALAHTPHPGPSLRQAADVQPCHG